MGTISQPEAQLYAVEAPSCGIAVQDRVQDQLFGQIPFVYVDGRALTVAYVSGDGLESHAAQVATTGASPPATFPTVDASEIALSHFTTILEVDSLILTQYGSRRNILRSLIDVKVASIIELFRETIVTSTGPPVEGLLTTGEANKVTANGGAGGAVQAGEVEEMLSLLSPGDNLSNRYLVMNAKALTHLRAGAYQNEVYFLSHPLLGPVPTIGGVPVLVDDHFPTDEGASNDQTSIVGVVLEADTGYFGVLPCGRRGSEVTVVGPTPLEGTDTVAFKIWMDAGAGTANSRAVAKLAPPIAIQPRTSPFAVPNPEECASAACGPPVRARDFMVHLVRAGAKWLAMPRPRT